MHPLDTIAPEATIVVALMVVATLAYDVARHIVWHYRRRSWSPLRWALAALRTISTDPGRNSPAHESAERAAEPAQNGV